MKNVNVKAGEMMRSKLSLFVIVFTLNTLVLNTLVEAAGSKTSAVCSGYENHRETCQIASEYLAIKVRASHISEFRHFEIDPDRFADVIARRFINRPDWEKFLAAGHGTDNPVCVYDPKPSTWNNWQLTTETKVVPAALAHRELTLEVLLDWNKSALVNTLAPFIKIGALKQYPNYGNNLTEDVALNEDGREALEEIRFMGDGHRLFYFPFVKKAQAKLKWRPLVCREKLAEQYFLKDLGPECQEIFLSAKKWAGDEFWAKTLETMNGPLDFKRKDYWFNYACWPRLENRSSAVKTQEAQCGQIIYPEPQRAEPVLRKILDVVNRYVTSPEKKQDPLVFAARIQRQLVGLHPFNKGNGRGSRWVMDYITTALGLPPILVENMDLDLSTSENVYEKGAFKGARESLQRMSNCLDLYERTDDLNSIQSGRCMIMKPVSESDKPVSCDVSRPPTSFF